MSEFQLHARRYLAQNPVQGVRELDVCSALEAGRRASVGPGHTLFTEGTPSDTMVWLLQGSVRVVMRDPLTKRPREIARVNGPAMVGHMGVVDKTARSATCLTLTDCDVVIFDSALVWSLLGEPSARGTALRRLLLSSLARQLAQGSAQLEGLFREASAPRKGSRDDLDEQDSSEIMSIAGVLAGWKVDTSELDEVRTAYDDEQRRLQGPRPKG